MKSWRRISLPVLAAGLLTAVPALASVRLGLGADYWFNPDGGPGVGIFKLDLTVDTRVAEHLSLGGRFGALITSEPVPGVPLDFDIRAHFDRLYIEGLVGPWFVFENATFPVRFHGAFGFGLQVRGISFGLEVGYLSPWPIGGLRVAFRF